MQRPIELDSSIDDALLLGFSGREGLSMLGGFEISIKSKLKNIDAKDMLGQNVTVMARTLEDQPERHFNGYITRWSGVTRVRDSMDGAEQTWAFLYSATVSPWLWFLTRSANSRIFENRTVPEIVAKVFEKYKDLGVCDSSKLGQHRTWPYCVQYRETDFNFISRLLEQEGICYYFKHEKGKHTLVLLDKNTDNPSPLYDTLKFVSEDQSAPEMIERWHSTYEIQPGRYATRDYNYETPKTKIEEQGEHKRKHALNAYEYFDFPGEADNGGEASAAAQVRIEELQSRYHTFNGGGRLRGLFPGCTFSLEGHPIGPFNDKHLVVSASYRANASSDHSGATGALHFECDFTAIRFDQQFRPARVTPKPLIQGPQTAVVVGQGEIETDELGRVKVKFHWNRPGHGDAQCSCFLRVSQPWAGKGWGGMSVPRVGQEVVVGFLEGDPDWPIIIGRVYNPDQSPPFMDAKGKISGLKSQTVEGSGYNELFMDDSAGAEKISLHAQYDMTTEVLHDQTSTIKNNRTDDVKVDDKLSVGGKRTVAVTGDQKTDITGKRETTIAQDEKLSVTGKRETTVQQDNSLTVMGKITESAMNNFEMSSVTEIKLSVGGSVVEITPMQIKLSMGPSSITIDASGISLTGVPKISLNG